MGIKLVPTRIGERIIEHIKSDASTGMEHLDASTSKKRLQQELITEYGIHKPSNKPDRFQHPKSMTIVIYDEKNDEVYRKNGRISKKMLNKLASRYPKATVLTSIWNGLFRTIPIKQYKKLCKIKFVLFERSLEFLSHEFPDDLAIFEEWFELESLFEYIYSVNHLLMIISMEDAFEKALQIFTSAKFFRMSNIEKIFKILYRNGRATKMTFEEFIDEYKLDADWINPYTEKIK